MKRVACVCAVAAAFAAGAALPAEGVSSGQGAPSLLPVNAAAPPPVDASTAASLTSELAQFLEVTARAKKPAAAPRARARDDGDDEDGDDDDDDDTAAAAAEHRQRAHHHRHAHRHRHHAHSSFRFRSVPHVSEAELDRRAKEYAKWAAEYWAPRTMYEHYYSHKGFAGKYYPKGGEQPRFAEDRARSEARRAPASPPHPVSPMDQIAHLGHPHQQQHLAYGGPMEAHAGAPTSSLVESGAEATQHRSGSSPYGLSSDRSLGAAGYGTPQSRAPDDMRMPASVASLFHGGGGGGGEGTISFGQQPQPQQPPRMMQQQPQQQQAPPMQQPMQFRQQFGMQQQQQQQQQQFAPAPAPGRGYQMPPAHGTPMPFYAPTAYPPPAPNQVPTSAATVNGAAPGQQTQQMPTATNMRFSAATGAGGLPPMNFNPAAPNAPRFQQQGANSYPFGGAQSLLETGAVVHPNVDAAARHPFRGQLPTPLHAEHMEAFPLL